MDSLVKFFDKILPLVSTLLGAYITYFVTVSSKKSELKLKAQTKARDEYWIPFSIAISNLQKKIMELTRKENCYVSFNGENSCERELYELLKYLQADKRIYFYEKTRIAGIDVPVDAGVMPVTNRAQIERMVTMCGATLPVKFQKVLHKYENNKEALLGAGLAYTINQIVDLIASDVDGVHIYTMKNPAVAMRICDGIRNLV